MTSRTRRSRLAPAATLALLISGAVTATAAPSSAAPVPAVGVDLTAATSFAVLAGTSLTNNSGGTTLVSGDVGSPSQTTDPVQSEGTNYKSGPVLAAAFTALSNAIADINARAATLSSPTGIDLGGLALFPGVYAYAGNVNLTGTLTFDAGGDPDAVFIVRTAGTLSTTANSTVSLVNGASACNIFWVPQSATTLGANSIFRGSILSQSAGIAVGDNTTLLPGRVLSGGSVSLRNNQVTRPTCDPHPSTTDVDGDGLTGADEALLGTDPNLADTDGGTVDDGVEVAVGTNPLDPSDDLPVPPPDTDPDGDGLTNADEARLGTDPNRSDTDADGLRDDHEVSFYATSPLLADTDRDGLADGSEARLYRTDPLDPDTDGGTVYDGTEVASGTDPLNAADDVPPTGPVDTDTDTDTDGDGLDDTTEIQIRTNPSRADTDRDGLRDGHEVNRTHTNPRRADTDRDGLRDGREVKRTHTSPRRPDTDRDGLVDGREVRRTHTDPSDKDTDRDGLSDGYEVRHGTNPVKRSSR